MVALMDTATSLPTLLDGFVRVQHEAVAACRAAVPLLSGPDERALVLGLRQDSESHLNELRRMAALHGLAVTDRGTPHEAQTIGRIRLAHRRGGDAEVLQALARGLRDAVSAYERAFRNTALTETTLPIVQRAAADLKRHCARLGDAARLAA